MSAQSYTQGTRIAPLTLPAATGGDGALSYGLTPAPPPGLTLDTATAHAERHADRAAGGAAIHLDGDGRRRGHTASLTFAITVAQDLTPTFEDAAVSAQSYTQGTRIAPLTLPAATGGDGALSYGLTPAPPPGLTLDAATRTLSGTPTEPQGARRYTLDGDGRRRGHRLAHLRDHRGAGPGPGAGSGGGEARARGGGAAHDGGGAGQYRRAVRRHRHERPDAGGAVGGAGGLGAGDGAGRGGRRAPALRGGPARRRRAARLRGARVEPVDDGRRAVRGERLLGASGRVGRRGRGVQPGDTAVVGVGPWRFGDVLGPRRCGARLRRRAAHGLARAGRAGPGPGWRVLR